MGWCLCGLAELHKTEVGEGHGKKQRDVVPVLSAAMAEQLELEPATAPATVLEFEGTGR